MLRLEASSSNSCVMGAKCRYFNDFAAITKVNDLEASADDHGIAKQLFDFLRRSIGGNVKILGGVSQQQVTNASSNQKGVVAALIQSVKNFQRIR